MNLYDLNESSGALLFESTLLTEERSLYESWKGVGNLIVEKKLDPETVKQLFTAIAQGAAAGGQNRTLIGKGVDKATDINAKITGAYNGLLQKVSNMGPVKAFDDKMDQVFGQLKDATGGDEGVAKYVMKYRNFAQQHPVAQSLIYSALIAAAGLATGGAGAPAAIGLLKATDRLLQGDKVSQAIMKGGTAAGLAMGAQAVKGALSGGPQLSPNAGSPAGDFGGGTMAGSTDATTVGSPAGDAAGGTGGGVDTYKPGAAGGSPAGDTGGSMGDTTPRDAAIQRSVDADNPGTPQPRPAQDITIKRGDTLSAIAKANKVSVQDLMKANPDITNPNVLQVGQHVNVPQGTYSPTYDQGVGTAADTAKKVASGEYLPPKQALAKATKAVAAAKLKESVKPTNSLLENRFIDHRMTAEVWQLNEHDAKIGNFYLTEEARVMMFKIITNEGLWDTIKGAGAAVANKIGTVAGNVTNKVTYDKLNKAWSQGPGFSYSGGDGSADSKRLFKFLMDQGIDMKLIRGTFKSLNIPVPKISGGAKKKPAATSTTGTSGVPNIKAAGAASTAPETPAAPAAPAAPSAPVKPAQGGPAVGGKLAVNQYTKGYEMMTPAERA